MSPDDGEPMTHAEWVRFGAKMRGQCRAASSAGLVLSGAMIADALLAPMWAWHWWALLSAYTLSQAAYHWFDARFWQLARLETRRMRRAIARECPDYLEEFDRRFPEASEPIATRPPEPSEPPP